jgi:hypothetical protein
VVLLLNGHVFWWGRITQDVRTPGAAEAAETAAALIAFARDERLPALRRALEAGIFSDDLDDFGWGLARILDGVEHVIGARAAPRPASSDDRGAPPADGD